MSDQNQLQRIKILKKKKKKSQACLRLFNLCLSRNKITFENTPSCSEAGKLKINCFCIKFKQIHKKSLINFFESIQNVKTDKNQVYFFVK